MPSPDRKKSKHKKKEKESRHSSDKHKSKKKKSSRTPSRNREKKKESKKEQKNSPQNTQTLSDKQLTDMFGSLPGFNLDILKKIQEQMKDGRKPVNDDQQQQLMGLSTFGQLPYIHQQIPISLPIVGYRDKKSSRLQKNMKNTFKQRMLIPLTVDTLMNIIEDPFYQDQFNDEINTQLRKRVIQLIKKRIEDQKQQDEFNDKIDKLDDELQKFQPKSDVPQKKNLNIVQSIFNLLKNKQISSDIIDQDLKEIITNISDKQNISEQLQDAKVLFKEFEK